MPIVNLALGRPVTSNLSGRDTHPLPDCVDGNFSTFAETTPQGQPSYCQVDLGKVLLVNEIIISHRYNPGIFYKETKTEISTDGINWEVIFDSAISGTYEEIQGGKTYQIDKEIRYIRDWANANNQNTGSQWTEIQALGESPPPC